MLIIITGPPGAGKSTVSEALAEKLPRAAQFSQDTVRHFIKGGNIPPWETGEEAQAQMKLGDDIVNDIIKRYLDNQYVVILDGVYSDKDIVKYRQLFSEVRGFLLLPSLEVLQERDINREEEKRVPDRVEPLHKAYTEQEDQLFKVLDTSNQSSEETINHIYNQITK